MQTNNLTEIEDFDLRIDDLKELSMLERFKRLVAIVEENSSDLISAGSRVGSITASINTDGNLVIKFVSRYPIRKIEGVL